MIKKRKKYTRKKPRKRLIEEAEKLTFEILLYKRGDRCEICGVRSGSLGTFHILPKGRYPRIRFHERNLLVAGWWCCHYSWHHDFYIARDRIVPRIKVLREDDYEDRLRALDLGARPLSEDYLKLLVMSLKKELKALERKWQHGKI